MGLLSWFRKPQTAKPKRSGEKAFAAGWNSGFEAAKANRLTDDWQPGSLSPSSIHRMDGRLLRERARDLVINNPLAASAVAAYISNVVECGITPKLKSDDADERMAWSQSWNQWASKEADCTGMLHFYELQSLFLEEVIVAGGCLVRFVVVPRGEMRGRRNRAAIELIPEERFADDTDTFVMWKNQRKSENPISRGVEIDMATGRPVAFWVHPTHPNSTEPGFVGDPIKIPADQAHYAFFKKRIGQYRGWTLLHAAIMHLWKLGYYTDNELMASAIKSCFSAIITTEDNPDFDGLNDGDPDDTTVDAYNNKLEKLQPGIVARLRPGENVQGVGPNTPGGDATPWLMMILRSIASGSDLSYEELARDYSKGSFSSVRAAMNADRKRFRRMQRFVINHFCQPALEHWSRWAAISGQPGFPTVEEFASSGDEYMAVQWRAPGWASVNPREDAEAVAIRLANHTITRERVLAEEGEDFEDTAMQSAREADRLEDLGLSAQVSATLPSSAKQQNTQSAEDMDGNE